MKTLTLNLKGRKEREYVRCDRYEEEQKTVGDRTEDWLVIYVGDKEAGRYRMADVIGYHEEQPREITL